MDATQLLAEVKKTDAALTEIFDTKLTDFEQRMRSLELRQGRPGGDVEHRGGESAALARWLRGEQKSITPLSVTGDGLGVVARSDWSDQVFALVREYSPLRQVANVVVTDRESWEGLVDTGQPDAAWVAETATRAETAASFLGRHRIAPAEVFAYPVTTLALLEDSEFAVEQWLQRKVAEKFARLEADAFINGNGTGKPRGILDYGRVPVSVWDWDDDPADYTIATHFTEGLGDSADAIEVEDLFAVVDSLEAAYLPRAVWMMNRATRNALRKLRDGDNRFFYQPSLAAALPDTLLGYPVVLAEDLPGPTDGEPCLLFGDFREGYTIVQRQGITVQRDTLTRPGFVRWYVRARVGGAVTNPGAFRALQIGEYTST